MSSRSPVVAITPARDEADRIAGLVRSMAAQTVRPRRWIVVDDGSADGTADAARFAAAAAGLDELDVVERRAAGEGRSFASKADAVAVGWAELRNEDPSAGLVAVIDADVVLPPDYFARVVAAFDADPQLGVAGGVYRHPVAGREVVDRPPAHHVPGPSQVFRRVVWEQIGGYRSLPFGGIDTLANVEARRAGWTTRHLPDLVVGHTRRMGTGGGLSPVRAEYRKGRQDYDLASGLLFELGKTARRLGDRPMVVGAVARLAGYVRGGLGRHRSVQGELADFIRAEQRARLRGRLAVDGNR